MNRLRFVSDLHLEFKKSIYTPALIPLYSIPKNDNKYYLALLGDIGNPYKPQFNDFLEKVSPLYEKVFFVPGNHEYYNLDIDEPRDVETVKTKLKNICSYYNNIVILDNKVDYIDNFKLIGSTLWSTIDNSHKYYLSTKINDYLLIRKTKFDNITVDDTNKWNSESIKFIESELETSFQCIVLTHHAPLFSNSKLNQFTASSQYYNSINNQAFHNDLKNLIKPPIYAWLYGHTHYASKFYFNNVLIATNQLGYSNEEDKISFDPLCEIVLDQNQINSI